MAFEDKVRERILRAALDFGNGLMFWWNCHNGVSRQGLEKFALGLLAQRNHKDN